LDPKNIPKHRSPQEVFAWMSRIIFKKALMHEENKHISLQGGG